MHRCAPKQILVAYSGITTSEQEEVLEGFKEGKYKILVATAVAEEGLDIQACNIVIRYDYSTNEIGRVQTKGTLQALTLNIVTLTKPRRMNCSELSPSTQEELETWRAGWSTLEHKKRRTRNK